MNDTIKTKLMILEHERDKLKQDFFKASNNTVYDTVIAYMVDLKCRIEYLNGKIDALNEVLHG